MQKQSTKTKLAAALETLMDTRSIEHITVGDIAEKANMSRTTFYRSFTDKYALMNWVYTCYLDELREKYKHITCYYRMMYDQTAFLQTKRNFFRCAFEPGTNQTFSEAFQNVINEYLVDNYTRYSKEKTVSSRTKYLLDGYATGVYVVLEEWLLSGAEESPQYMTELLIELMPVRFRKVFTPTYPDFSAAYAELSL